VIEYFETSPANPIGAIRLISVVAASRLVAAAISVRPLRPQRPSWPPSRHARFAMALSSRIPVMAWSAHQPRPS